MQNRPRSGNILVSMEDKSLTKKRKVIWVTRKRKVLAEKKCITKRVSIRSEDEFIPQEIYEQILVRLDVVDIIRCKSVSKSWQSLISSRHFIKVHHNHRFNNNKDTTISHVVLPFYSCKPGQKYYIVGSSNGLTCINTFNGNEFIVANPCTREENMVQRPLDSELSCWGFGYDSLSDDYKIVFGVQEGMDRTSFQVLSLKSNVWKHVGHVNYICSSPGELATLCNGALHWVMHREHRQKSWIISFDLSKEVFKEIPQPHDARYNKTIKEDIPCPNMMVGIKDEYLCLWRFDIDEPNIWILKNYNVKESWVTLGSDCQRKLEFFEYPSMDGDQVKNDIPDVPSAMSPHDTWFLEKCMCVPTTIMQSLISPHPSRQ